MPVPLELVPDQPTNSQHPIVLIIQLGTCSTILGTIFKQSRNIRMADLVSIIYYLLLAIHILIVFRI